MSQVGSYAPRRSTIALGVRMPTQAVGQPYRPQRTRTELCTTIGGDRPAAGCTHASADARTAQTPARAGPGSAMYKWSRAEMVWMSGSRGETWHQHTGPTPLGRQLAGPWASSTSSRSTTTRSTHQPTATSLPLVGSYPCSQRTSREHPPVSVTSKREAWPLGLTNTPLESAQYRLRCQRLVGLVDDARCLARSWLRCAGWARGLDRRALDIDDMVYVCWQAGRRPVGMCQQHKSSLRRARLSGRTRPTVQSGICKVGSGFPAETTTIVRAEASIRGIPRWISAWPVTVPDHRQRVGTQHHRTQGCSPESTDRRRPRSPLP